MRDEITLEYIVLASLVRKTSQRATKLTCSKNVSRDQIILNSDAVMFTFLGGTFQDKQDVREITCKQMYWSYLLISERRRVLLLTCPSSSLRNIALVKDGSLSKTPPLSTVEQCHWSSTDLLLTNCTLLDANLYGVEGNPSQT